jgi:beta-lactamase regulating signal transducer with metallopeptidase domain
MGQLFLSQCDALAGVAAAAFGNAAIPSLLAAAFAYLAMRLKAWNSASRYCAWWLILAFVVLLPFAAVLSRPHASQVSQSAPLLSHDFGIHVSPGQAVPKLKLENLAIPGQPQLPSRTPFESILAALVMLCCGAVGVQLSRLIIGLFANARLKRRAVIPQDSILIASFVNAARILHPRRKVSFAISDEVAAPGVIGYSRPCILLPRPLIERLEPAEIEQVLSHELAHVSRYDDWIIVIQRLIEALFIFHPLVYFIARRIDLDREMACDDHAIALSQPRTYAACLTKIAELTEYGPAMALALPLLARKSHLAARVEMILDRRRAHVPALSLTRLLPFAIAGIVAGCVSLRAPALIAFPIQQRPAENAPPAKQSTNASGQQIDSIAVTSADGTTTTFERNGNQRVGHSPFPRGTIVFEQNGESCIIRDRSTLDAAHELLQPQEELSRQQEALAAQEEKLAQTQAQLAQQQEAVANRRLDTAAIKNMQKQIRDLEQKLRSMDVERTIKTADDAQRRIAELQSVLGDMQSRMGDEQGKMGEAQGKLGEQQGLLGEQQGRLGEQQGRLGEQQAREAERVEQVLKELIRRAQAQGLAKRLR